MRHGMVNRKLGRTSSHRAAMFRNQLASLIEHERIITTLPKAKELRPQIERLITLGRNDSVHNRRQASAVVGSDGGVSKLFDTLAPRFADRPGGYTRIIKLGARRGDRAEMAILEFVGYEPKIEEKSEAASKKAALKKEAKAPAAEPEEEAAAPAAEEEKPKKKTASKKPAAKKKADEGEAKPKKKAAPAKRKSDKKK